MKTIYSFLALIFLASAAIAQEFPYTFYYLDEPYEAFDDGTDAVPQVWDSPFAVVPLGFEFEYFGVPITTFNLGGVGAMLTCNDADMTVQSIFLPYSSDLSDVGVVSGDHTSIISYKTTGEAPDRVFHMQWSDCALGGEIMESGTTNNRVNFQIRLYEGTNDVAIHYGPHTITDNSLLHDGNNGPSIGFYANLTFATGFFDDYWLVGGPTTAPQPLWGDPMGGGNDNSFNPLDSDPDDGTLYYFSTSAVNIHEAATADLRVYPNPTSESLYVQSTSSLTGTALTVRNLAGQSVLQTTLEPDVQSLDVTELPAGVYVLEGEVEGVIVRERFVKE